MEPDIYEILGKHFRNEITSDEKLLLEKWLITENNKQIFQEVEKVWKHTGRLDIVVNPDIEKEWERFNRLIVDNSSLLYIENRKNEIPRKLKTWGLRVAAIFLIGLASFATYKILRPLPINKQLVSVSSQNEIKVVTLPDGSVVTLNKLTTIEYPEKFISDTRQVNLTGEAFFEVTKGNGSFTVNAGKTKTIVLGTQFNLKAPAGKDYTELFVSEGKVMFCRADTINNEVFLSGELGVFNNTSGILIHEKSDDPNKIAWKTGDLVFNNYPMDYVQHTLSNYFNKVIIIDPEIKNLQFTGSFNKPTIDEILEVISVSLDVDSKVKGDSVFVFRIE